MKKALIDGRATKELIHNLEKLDIKAIKTLKCKELYDAISYHVDILTYKVDNNNIIVAPNIYVSFKNILIKNGINPIKGNTTLKSNYPYNIAYNVARVGKYAIHNFNYTDLIIKKYLEKEKAKLIHVKQGYSKCSIGIVNENAIITSDKGIAKVLINNTDIDVLTISPGYIRLENLNYGFIGGCMASLCEKSIVFSGSLNNHPDEKNILKFLRKHNKEPIFLANTDLVDLGSVYFFD